MRLIADLHIHSKFSRATSRSLDIAHIARWGSIKGLDIIATGDVTHPGWLEELERELEEDGSGFLLPRNHNILADLPRSLRREVRFVLQGEVSSIYKKDGKVRKVHTCVYFPRLKSARKYSEALERLGNIHSDGRPILGIEPPDLLRLALDCDERAFVIPAHVWTPHFSLFGAHSGFDAIEECFGDQTSLIFAIETGLSSDIPMNRSWSALDRFAAVSSSDAHSPDRLGREATLFDLPEPTYGALTAALRSDDRESGLLGTIEFFPEEGKYHFDGHRKCGVSLSPEETRAMNNLCPVCGKRLTPGVLGRVLSLADRRIGSVPQHFPGQMRLIPLAEVLSEILRVGSKSKKVQARFTEITRELGPELHVLAFAPVETVEQVDPLLAEALRRMRSGKVITRPGYDGRYGTVRVFAPGEVEYILGQMELFGKPSGIPNEKGVPAIVTAASGSVQDSPAPAESAQHYTVTTDAEQWDAGLTDEQRLAASHSGPACLVLAGPGTGKTRTMVARVLFLAHGGARMDRIVVVTFTNRAAEEALARLGPVLRARRMQPPWVGTFHSLALALLGKLAEARGSRRPKVVSPEDAQGRLRRVCESRGIRIGATHLAKLYRTRSLGIQGIGEPELAALREFDEQLEAEGLCDLDGLVGRLVRESQKDPSVARWLADLYDHVLVDEYQDIGPDQFEFLRALKPDGAGLFVVGDPNQSIYSFRGAGPWAFQRFRSEFRGVAEFRLGLSHRCPTGVLAAASAVLGRDRAPVEPVEQSTPGTVVAARAKGPAHLAAWIVDLIEGHLGGTFMHTARLDGDLCSPGDIAVLARTHQALEPVSRALSERGIPFETVLDRPLWDTDFVAEVIRALREATPDADALSVARGALEAASLAPEPRVRQAFERRLQGRTAQNALEHLLLLRHVDAFGFDPQRVQLLTMHAAKGLEFRAVFVWLGDAGSGRVDAQEVLDEERRLLYVAMTRSRDFLGIGVVEAREGPSQAERFFEMALASDPTIPVERPGSRRPRRPIQQRLL